MLESKVGFPVSFSSGDMDEVQSTELEDVDMLEFFLDTSDSRFFVLHANEISDNADPIIKILRDMDIRSTVYGSI